MKKYPSAGLRKGKEKQSENFGMPLGNDSEGFVGDVDRLLDVGVGEGRVDEMIVMRSKEDAP